MRNQTTKKKTKPRQKKAFVKIPVQPYGRTVIVSINQTDLEFKKSYLKMMEKENIDGIDILVEQISRDSDRHLGRTLHMHGNCIVRVYDQLKDPTSYGTLVHELFHAVDFILDDCGLRLVDGSDEAYTYLIGYLMEETMKAHK